MGRRRRLPLCQRRVKQPPPGNLGAEGGEWASPVLKPSHLRSIDPPPPRRRRTLRPRRVASPSKSSRSRARGDRSRQRRSCRIVREAAACTQRGESQLSWGSTSRPTTSDDGRRRGPRGSAALHGAGLLRSRSQSRHSVQANSASQASSVVERAPSPRKLSDTEQAVALAVLHSDELVDQPPQEVYATLLSRGVYLASIRTLLRLDLGARERRRQICNRQLGHRERCYKSCNRQLGDRIRCC